MVMLSAMYNPTAAQMYGVKVIGPSSDSWSGWAIRKGIDANLSIQVLVTERLANAEKFQTMEQAEEVAFLLATQRPQLIGRIKIMKLYFVSSRWTYSTLERAGEA